MVNADGSMARPPIAPIEVQGYAYLAKLTIAELYERAGEREIARQLRQQAGDLRARFNRDFWLPDQGIFALALQAGMRPAAVRVSNPGQALWSGIVDEDKAQPTADMLLADDMFNGWGVRTLSSREHRYNPIGYHLGTVWPHDNAIIAAGLRRYGFDQAFERLFAGIIDAASYFQNARLPELFAGFTRDEYSVPVHYPVACHPQAWAAGAVPYMVISGLGLVPEAFDRRLRIVRPLLAKWTTWLEIRRLRVGSASVDLRFERAKTGIGVETLKVDGELDVVVEG
jgi:glycogen debranching enzyme